MSQPKVSVIIPVYNTAAYLRECIGSITSQTLREIEIITVNDGSKDDSLAVLEELAAADERIRVLSQPNGGAAVARNTGWDIARGEYLHFMDSDDVLEPDALELSYAKCSAEKLDFVIFDAVVMNEIPGYTFNYRRTDRLEDRVYGGMELLDKLLAIGGYSVQPSLNVISHDFLKRIGLRYFPVMHEDELFSALLYMQAGRVGCIDRAFFHRRVRPDSIMTSKFTRRRIDAYVQMLAQLDLFIGGRDGATQKMTRRMQGRIINGLMHNAASMPYARRMQLLRVVLSKYRSLANPKAVAILLLPPVVGQFKKMMK